ncbi:hypothetical protein [Lentzea sp. NBRC 105346]|uniref:hypothetical protein n=1 Tax=Lentzea sp. NBRC 105346 TaxID=3032205 RepID=UPI002555F134|nr:hypothetical protein [Lentzea sp. NBRC 105346]
MTYPGGGQGGWGDQSGQSGWGQGEYGDYTDRYPTTGGFPQQGFGGSYGGLGVFSGGDEPPKKDKKKLWLVIGAVVLVLLVGGGITTFLLLNNKSEEPPVAQSTSETPTPTSATPEETETSTPPPNGDCKPRKEGMTCVATALGYNYDVPKGWQASDVRYPIPSMPGATITGVAEYGAYKCEGKEFHKGTDGGVLVDKGDINKVAADLAKAVATDFYTGAAKPTVTVGAPKPVKFPHKTKEGKDITVEGVQVDATVTTSGDKCLASKGIVKVLLLVGTTKFHAFIVNGDLEGGGGGSNPPLPKEPELQEMINSLTPTS